MRKCKNCGLTAETETPGDRYWVREDLCSGCAIGRLRETGSAALLAEYGLATLRLILGDQIELTERYSLEGYRRKLCVLQTSVMLLEDRVDPVLKAVTEGIELAQRSAP